MTIDRYHFNWNTEATQRCNKLDCAWGFHSSDEMETARVATAEAEALLLANGALTMLSPKRKRLTRT